MKSIHIYFQCQTLEMTELEIDFSYYQKTKKK